MKRYVLIFLFNNDKNKVLLMKRKKNPFINCYNGIGGKIELNESVFEAAIRECKEEVNMDMNPKMFITYLYPNSKDDSTTAIELNVLYDFVDQKEILENEEGTFSWFDLSFALDFENKQLAGYANVATFIREILVSENIIKFYND